VLDEVEIEEVIGPSYVRDPKHNGSPERNIVPHVLEKEPRGD
jgi:hypothetical protein